METQESLRQIENLRLRFQINNRLRLECLAAVSRVFREHGESLSDELLSSLVFAVPDELPGERPPHFASSQPGGPPPGGPPADKPPTAPPPAGKPPAGKPPAGYPPSQPPSAPPTGVPPPGGPPGQPKPSQPPPPPQPAPGGPPPRPKSESGRKRVAGERAGRTQRKKAS
jgi:hypothetical protein